MNIQKLVQIRDFVDFNLIVRNALQMTNLKLTLMT